MKVKPKRKKAPGSGKILLPKGARKSRISESEDPTLQIEYWLHCSRLRLLCWPYHDIAKDVADKFDLPRVPSIQTVAQWLDKAMKLKIESLNAASEQLRHIQKDRIQLLLRKWLPIAIGEKLQLMRHRKVDGETVEIIDEDAYDEQIKAASLCAKLIMQDAELDGLLQKQDIDKSASESLQEFVMRAVLQSIVPRPARDSITGDEIEQAPGPILTLEAGDLQIDRMG